LVDVHWSPQSNSMKGNAMNYLDAWREGHFEGMALSLRLINEFTGCDFQSASEVVLYIKELEEYRKQDYFKEVKPAIDISEKTMDSLANKIAMNQYLWS